jgi:tRNA(fMet)-specific endonuclease VapC
MIYALDSNIISFLLKENDNIFAAYQQKIAQGHEFVIAPIVYYEIERGLLAKNLLAKRRAFIKFCETVEIGEFNLDVWQKAAEVYAKLSRQGKLIGEKYDGDYFIAAYCILNGYTLITNNKEHFERIDELGFEIWQE